MTWGSMKPGWSPVYIELGCPVWAHSANIEMRTKYSRSQNVATLRYNFLVFRFQQPFDSVKQKSTMIHCYHQPIASGLTLSSQRLASFDIIEGMSSGYVHSLDESNSGMNDQATESLAAPLDLDDVKSGEHSSDIKPKPKRPLSAYNWFFHSERKNILNDTPIRKEGKPRRSHGKIGFADLARSIAAKWKSLSKAERLIYDEKAKIDKERYAREMEEWKKCQSDAASQLPSPSIDLPVHGDLWSLPNDTFDVTEVISQSLVRPRASPAQAPSMESYLRGEMKTTSNDFLSSDSYSLSGIFTAELSRRLQSPFQVSTSPPSVFMNRTSPNMTLSTNMATSPNMTTLASQLGDESTELFLDLFRDPGSS